LDSPAYLSHGPSAGTEDKSDLLGKLLAELPANIDNKTIEDQSRRAQTRYNLDHYEMPAPLWAKFGFDATGRQARDLLLQNAANGKLRALSIYIHLPFCNQKCSFCDCHSFYLHAGRLEKESEYVRALLADIRFWREETSVGSRLATTVHFGGGTPNALGADNLKFIVDACKDSFAVNDATEWAIETTARLIEESELLRLRQLGFSRLHVGVQTLDEKLRSLLGRKTPAPILLERLGRAMNMGFITSVDVLYGLPGQDALSLLSTLHDLISLGIHGFSLYRLNLSQKNRGLLRRFPRFERSALRDCLLLQCAEQLLISAGYAKNHFVHYALPPDKNLYFRHVLRGEDLIGIGASASGKIGSMEYRCTEYPAYLENSACGGPSLQGAVMADSKQQAVDSLKALMICGQFGRAAFDACGCKDLFNLWISCGLARQTDSGQYALTATGSWLLGRMLQEVPDGQ
jgi:coproporphyrinogen III oxidase-like Fe-S oxidoreductase